jgi:rhodanese-related sulfurtransferase
MRSVQQLLIRALLPGLIAVAGLQTAFAQDWMNVPAATAAARVLAEMPDDYFTVRPAVARQQVASGGVLLLDVREAAEYRSERIATARNIPVRQIAQLIGTLPKDRATPIMVYCRSGHRGAIALMVLRLAGYTNVRSLAGGLEAWKAAAFPVEQ